MPRGDGTGPAGLGPMTGWGRGYCLGYKVKPQRYGAPWCRGGFGAGRGWRRQNWATWMADSSTTPAESWKAEYMGPGAKEEQQYSTLSQEVESLKQYLQGIEEKLNKTKYNEHESEDEDK